jgi:hypothetical protein
MAHTYPNAQIHCIFSATEQHSFPDALREKISMYLIGIGHNQSLPILCAKATVHRVQVLIAVPRDVTMANAMLLLKAEFLTLAAQTPIQLRLEGQLRPPQRKGLQVGGGSGRLSPRKRREAPCGI